MSGLGVTLSLGLRLTSSPALLGCACGGGGGSLLCTCARHASSPSLAGSAWRYHRLSPAVAVLWGKESHSEVPPLP